MFVLIQTKLDSSIRLSISSYGTSHSWLPYVTYLHRAAWDTVPHGIPCRMGYRAAWDTVPHGIPCRMGYAYAWDHLLLTTWLYATVLGVAQHQLIHTANPTAYP